MSKSPVLSPPGRDSELLTMTDLIPALITDAMEGGILKDRVHIEDIYSFKQKSGVNLKIRNNE